MPICRCPKCNSLFDAKASEFGGQRGCPECGVQLTLDTSLLARFNLPDVIHIQLIGQKSDVATRRVDVKYGYPLGQFKTDDNGALTLTKAMIENAINDYVSRDGIMDHKYDDLSLHRYLLVVVGQVQTKIDLADEKQEISVEMFT
jgi:hypothetical protein